MERMEGNAHRDKHKNQQERTGILRRGYRYITQSVNLRGVQDFVSLYARTYRTFEDDVDQDTMEQWEKGSSRDIVLLPHIETADLRNIDWSYLKNTKHYKGVLFDKDHTLTLPYDMKLHPYAKESLEKCVAVFGRENVVVYSNSAGLEQYDPDGYHAGILEESLGIRVLRHTGKKPHVSHKTVEELVEHFGCETTNLIMVGDRYMTDVVFGNRLGMLTIRPAPFTEISGSKHREPSTVRISRRLEEALVERCRTRGMCAPKCSPSL